jgi:hypothetical protein
MRAGRPSGRAADLNGSAHDAGDDVTMMVSLSFAAQQPWRTR